MAITVMTSPISGRIGDKIFSHNKGGAYIKNFRIPTNPRTDAQNAARVNLAIASKLWNALPTADKLAWNDFASNNPIINRLGQSVLISGAAWFTRANANILASGTSGVPAEVWNAGAVSIQTLVLTENSLAAGLEIQLPEAVPAGHRVIIRAFVTSNPGIGTPGRFKQIETVAASAAKDVPVQTPLTEKFGDLIAAGNRVWFEAVDVHTASGAASSVYRSEAMEIAA